jgi:hypothetical protein
MVQGPATSHHEGKTGGAGSGEQFVGRREDVTGGEGRWEGKPVKVDGSEKGGKLEGYKQTRVPAAKRRSQVQRSSHPSTTIFLTLLVQYSPYS